MLTHYDILRDSVKVGESLTQSLPNKDDDSLYVGCLNDSVTYSIGSNSHIIKHDVVSLPDFTGEYCIGSIYAQHSASDPKATTRFPNDCTYNHKFKIIEPTYSQHSITFSLGLSCPFETARDYYQSYTAVIFRPGVSPFPYGSFQGIPSVSGSFGSLDSTLNIDWVGSNRWSTASWVPPTGSKVVFSQKVHVGSPQQIDDLKEDNITTIKYYTEFTLQLDSLAAVSLNASMLVTHSPYIYVSDGTTSYNLYVESFSYNHFNKEPWTQVVARTKEYVAL